MTMEGDQAACEGKGCPGTDTRPCRHDAGPVDIAEQGPDANRQPPRRCKRQILTQEGRHHGNCEDRVAGSAPAHRVRHLLSLDGRRGSVQRDPSPAAQGLGRVHPGICPRRRMLMGASPSARVFCAGTQAWPNTSSTVSAGTPASAAAGKPIPARSVCNEAADS